MYYTSPLAFENLSINDINDNQSFFKLLHLPSYYTLYSCFNSFMKRFRIKNYLFFITIVFFYLDPTKVLSEQIKDNELQKIQTFQSESFSTRIRFVVIHYTSIDWENSLKVLTSERYEVSSHYLIPENGDDTYSDQIKIFLLLSFLLFYIFLR